MYTINGTPAQPAGPGETRLADGAVLRIVDRVEKPPRALLLVPIIAQGDAIGAVILFSTEEHVTIGEAELKTCQTIASFLGRQMEA